LSAGIARVTARFVAPFALLAAAAAGCDGAGAESRPVPVIVLGSAGKDCPAGTTWDGARCSNKGQDECDPGAASPDGECTQSRPRAVIADDLPIAVMVRDPRPWRLKPGSVALLTTTAQRMEELLTTTPTGPERPVIMRRLGDCYVELSYAIRQARGKDDAVTAAAAKAITMYARVLADFPRSPGIDEVAYFLALEYERADRVDDARKTYLKLIQTWPSSRYNPLAYLAFAEHFFAEGAADPSKMQLAEQAYKEVIKYPPPDNHAFAYAHYKLGQAFNATGRQQEALSQFKKTIEATVTYPGPAAGQLAAEARSDLVAAYSAVGAGSKAYHFFRPLAGDEPGKDDRTVFMLIELGAAYGRLGSAGEAIAVFNDLLTRASGGRLCPQMPQMMGALASLDTPANAASRPDLARISQELSQRCP
jgi:tetratricopeptide (TPR) repeat protein